MDNIIHIDTMSLKPHPFNTKLYDENSKPEEFQGLITSIQEHGVKEPLFISPPDSSGTHFIHSGHRRFKAATELGLDTLPCIIEEPENVELSIVEHNRYRQKTVSELMREAEVLLEVETEKSRENSRLKQTNKGEKFRGRTTERVARALGIGGGTQLSKIRKVWEAGKTDTKVAEQIKRIDAGETSINAVFKSITRKEPEGDVLDFDLKVYSVWRFDAPDPLLGQPHPGAIPGQIIENLIYYFTSPGDLVYDPFGGGGITVDAAKRMNRRALVTDLAPVRDDIMQWDIADGFPAKATGAQLVFMDPPYWNQLQKEYENLSPETAAAYSLEDFKDFLQDIIDASFRNIAEGGYLAIIMMPQTFKLPTGIPFVDWPFETRLYMDVAGFTPFYRISKPWPTTMWSGHQVIKAKESKRLLNLHGDIIIGKKVSD